MAALPMAEANSQTLTPVDQLRDQVLQHAKAPVARILRGVYEKIKAAGGVYQIKNWKQLEEDPQFGDAALWMHAQVEQKTAEKLLQRGDKAQTIVHAELAIDLFNRIEVQDPYSAYLKLIPAEVARTEFILARAVYKDAKWIKAATIFERGFQRLNVHSASWAVIEPETLTAYAKICAEKKLPLCDAWVLRLSAQFPEASVEGQALQALKEKLHAPRYAKYERISQPYKAPDLDATALEEALRASSSERLQKMASFLDTYPRSVFRFRVRYLLGETFHNLDKKDAANITWTNLVQDAPVNYYGLLAYSSFQTQGQTQGLMSIDPGVFIPSAIPSATSDDPQLYPWEQRRLGKAESYLAEKAFDLAKAELKEIKAREALSSPFLMYLTQLNFEASNYSGVFALVTELIQRGYPQSISSYTLGLTLPAPYMDFIRKYSLENALDPFFVLSLIKQESSFDSEAHSSSGAQGLMQLMPATAVDVFSEVRRSQLTQVDLNIKLGTKYLGRLVKKYDGNWAYALAAYNAGPANLDRWLRDQSKGKKTLPEFIESIPFRETREYVASIFRNYYWYTRRMGAGGVTDPQPILKTFFGIPTPIPSSAPVLPSSSPSPSPAVSPIR